ncbi:MAG: hypothetical protein V3T05_00680, partial [Myxococcota bacterium]
GGIGFASSHVIPIYIIPKYSENAEVAKEFLLHLVNNYNNAVFNSELYNFPCWEETTPQLLEADGWLDQDPFGSRPLTKMNVLKTAGSWTTNVGHPGPANAAIGEVFTSYVLPDMFKNAVDPTIAMSVDAAVADAESRINTIFQKWRDAGLVGGG